MASNLVTSIRYLESGHFNRSILKLICYVRVCICAQKILNILIVCTRPGFVAMELSEAQPGSYNVIPSTYLPRQEGPFILTVKSSSPITITRIR